MQNVAASSLAPFFGGDSQNPILGKRCRRGETRSKAKAMDLRSQMILMMQLDAEGGTVAGAGAGSCVTPWNCIPGCCNTTIRTSHDSTHASASADNSDNDRNADTDFSRQFNAVSASPCPNDAALALSATATFSAAYAEMERKQQQNTTTPSTSAADTCVGRSPVHVAAYEGALHGLDDTSVNASSASPEPRPMQRHDVYVSANLADEAENSSGDTRRTSSSASEQDVKACVTSIGTKRPRKSEASSSKVRIKKEKLGERIMTLQQLICPFGKTDTASVLQQVVRYIDFLQNQIKVLSSPYLEGTPNPSPSPSPSPRPSPNPSESDAEGKRRCLRSRGLCLMPVSVCANHVSGLSNAADFWAPGTSGGNSPSKSF